MENQTRKDLENERRRVEKAIAAATKAMYQSESGDPKVRKILSEQRHSLGKRLALIDLILGFGDGATGYTERFFLAAKQRLARHEFTRLADAALHDCNFEASSQGIGSKLTDSQLMQLFTDDDA